MQTKIIQNSTNETRSAIENLTQAVTEANALYVLTRKKLKSTDRENDAEVFRTIEDVLFSLEIMEGDLEPENSGSAISLQDTARICEMWEMVAFVGFQCTLLLLRKGKKHVC